MENERKNSFRIKLSNYVQLGRKSKLQKRTDNKRTHKQIVYALAMAASRMSSEVELDATLQESGWGFRARHEVLSA